MKTEYKNIGQGEGSWGFFISAPSPGKDHLRDSVSYQATAGRLQLVQAFTVFQVTTTIRMHLSLQQKLRIKQPRVRQSVVPVVQTILARGCCSAGDPSAPRQPTQGRAAAAEVLLQTDLQFSCWEDRKFPTGTEVTAIYLVLQITLLQDLFGSCSAVPQDLFLPKQSGNREEKVIYFLTINCCFLRTQETNDVKKIPKF